MKLSATRPFVIALVSGAAFEGCSVFWVRLAVHGSPMQTALVSCVQALAQILGIGESVRDWRVAPFFVAGYGIGAYLAMRLA